MLKDYEINKPILETDRLIIRVINESDVADLKEWLGRDNFSISRFEHIISAKQSYSISLKFVSKSTLHNAECFLCYKNAINGKKIRHDICNVITSELKWIYKSDANGKKIRWSAVWKSIEIYILNDLSLENTMVLLRLLPEFEEVENHIY